MKRETSEIIKDGCLGLLLAMILMASPVHPSYSQTLSINEILWCVILPAVIIIPPLHRCLVKKIETRKGARVRSIAVAGLILGAVVSFLFGYMVIDYIGDMRSIFLSLTLFMYVFIWMGALFASSVRNVVMKKFGH